MVLVASCASDGPVKPHERGGAWSDLGLQTPVIRQVLHAEGRLYVAAGPGGVFLQDPAFTGEWRNMGLGYATPSLDLRGAQSIAMIEGTLLAVSNQGSDAEPKIWRYVPGTESWEGSNDGVGDGLVSGLAVSGCGSAFTGVLLDGVCRSTDGGRTWSQTFHTGFMQSLQVSTVGCRVFAYGRTSFSGPFAALSPDDGRTWAGLDAQTLLGTVTGEVVSMVSGEDSERVLVVATGTGGNRLFVFPQWNHEPTVNAGVLQPCFVDCRPSSADEIVAVGDGVSVSRDAGNTWVNYASPDGLPLGGAAVVWDTGVVVTWEESDDGARLFCLSLPGVPAADQPPSSP